MSFNRPMYDFCEGKKRITESTEAANYNIQTPVICGNCIQTDPRIMPNRTGVSLNSNTPWRFYAGPIDVESDLFNLNRPLSDCPSNKYHPNSKNCFSSNGQPAGQGVTCGTKPCEGMNTCNYSNQPYPEFCGQKVVEGFSDKAPQDRFRKNGQRCPDNNLVDMPDCYFGTEDTRLSNPPSTLKGTGINRFNPLCFNPQEKIFFPGEYHVPSRMVFKDNHRPCIASLANISADPLPNTSAGIPAPEISKVAGAFTAPLYKYDQCG